MINIINISNNYCKSDIPDYNYFTMQLVVGVSSRDGGVPNAKHFSLGAKRASVSIAIVLSLQGLENENVTVLSPDRNGPAIPSHDFPEFKSGLGAISVILGGRKIKDSYIVRDCHISRIKENVQPTRAPPCAWLLVAQNAEHESSDRECSDGLKSRSAARLAKRSGAARPASSSTSFCAVEASMRVPLDSLRTCERKCRRLNARGRPTFNCLPLVTWTEKEQKVERGEEEEGGVCAHSFESVPPRFFLLAANRI